MINILKKSALTLGFIAFSTTILNANENQNIYAEIFANQDSKNINNTSNTKEKDIANANIILNGQKYYSEDDMNKLKSQIQATNEEKIKQIDKNKKLEPKKFNRVQPISNFDDLNSVVENLAEKLLYTSKIKYNKMEEIAVTSFVDLHKLDLTNNLGRNISESFFDVLFTRGFNVSDFRGQENLTINDSGEYFLTRDASLLNKEISNKYILVGTYTTFENKILISARIINNTSGRLVASARSYYHTTDCTVLNTCPKKRKINIVAGEAYSNFYNLPSKKRVVKKRTNRKLSIANANHKKSSYTISNNKRRTKEISLLN
jgi:TolB-like protein